MSAGGKEGGPWNTGNSTQLNEEWQTINEPLEHVIETNGLTEVSPKGTKRNEKTVSSYNAKLAKERSSEIKNAVPKDKSQWSTYPDQALSQDEQPFSNIRSKK
jgi:Mn-containing catalase